MFVAPQDTGLFLNITKKSKEPENIVLTVNILKIPIISNIALLKKKDGEASVCLANHSVY